MKQDARPGNADRKTVSALVWLVFLLAGASTAVAQGSEPYHVSMDSIGEFDARSYSRAGSTAQPVSRTRERRSGITNIPPHTILLMIDVGAVSAKLAEACSSGRHIPQAVIEHVQPGSGKRMKIHLREVVITSVRLYRANPADVGRLEQIGLDYGYIRTSYERVNTPASAKPSGSRTEVHPAGGTDAADTGTDTVTDKDDPYKVTMSSIGEFSARSWRTEYPTGQPANTRLHSHGTVHEELVLVMKPGPLSAKLENACATGKHISKAVVERKFTEQGEDRIMRITMHQVVIARFGAQGKSQGVSASASDLQEMTLSAATIHIGYTETATSTAQREGNQPRGGRRP